jgi:putative addiction module killer protein
MVNILKTDIFASWLNSLKDLRARARIQVRIERLRHGNAGDVKPVGKRISELRIDVGQGYRVYFTKLDQNSILLLCGGDKNTQPTDIKTASKMIKDLKE